MIARPCWSREHDRRAVHVAWGAATVFDERIKHAVDLFFILNVNASVFNQFLKTVHLWKKLHTFDSVGCEQIKEASKNN